MPRVCSRFDLAASAALWAQGWNRKCTTPEVATSQPPRLAGHKYLRNSAGGSDQLFLPHKRHIKTPAVLNVGVRKKAPAGRRPNAGIVEPSKQRWVRGNLKPQRGPDIRATFKIAPSLQLSHQREALIFGQLVSCVDTYVQRDEWADLCGFQ